MQRGPDGETWQGLASRLWTEQRRLQGPLGKETLTPSLTKPLVKSPCGFLNRCIRLRKVAGNQGGRRDPCLTQHFSNWLKQDKSLCSTL